MSYTTIGQPTPRIEGPAKVTGATQYTADVALPGTLWGRALRSPLPHARIVHIDTSRAQQVPGVHVVLTGADVRGIRYGRRLFDVPVLAEDRVRFAGERVAAVAAEDRDAAEEALALIDVEYEELPTVFDPLEALEEDAPILHPEVNSYIGLPKPLDKPSNAFARDTWSKGNIDEGFAQADLIIENTFTVPRQHQAYLEPHSCLVWLDDQGRVQVWASSKVPYQVKEQLSVALGLPKERIRLNPVAIGGDYGGKGSPMDIPLAYFLAVRTGRPVRMVMDYVEELTAGNPRHAAIIQLKTGVKRDGTIVAHQARVVFDSGAYGGFKPVPTVNLGGAAKAGGPYKIPHVHIEGMQVYIPIPSLVASCAPLESRRPSSPSSPISTALPGSWGEIRSTFGCKISSRQGLKLPSGRATRAYGRRRPWRQPWRRPGTTPRKPPTSGAALPWASGRQPAASPTRQ